MNIQSLAEICAQPDPTIRQEMWGQWCAVEWWEHAQYEHLWQQRRNELRILLRHSTHNKGITPAMLSELFDVLDVQCLAAVDLSDGEWARDTARWYMMDQILSVVSSPTWVLGTAGEGVQMQWLQWLLDHGCSFLNLSAAKPCLGAAALNVSMCVGGGNAEASALVQLLQQGTSEMVQQLRARIDEGVVPVEAMVAVVDQFCAHNTLRERIPVLKDVLSVQAIALIEMHCVDTVSDIFSRYANGVGRTLLSKVLEPMPIDGVCSLAQLFPDIAHQCWENNISALEHIQGHKGTTSVERVVLLQNMLMGMHAWHADAQVQQRRALACLYGLGVSIEDPVRPMMQHYILEQAIHETQESSSHRHLKRI